MTKIDSSILENKIFRTAVTGGCLLCVIGIMLSIIQFGKQRVERRMELIAALASERVSTPLQTSDFDVAEEILEEITKSYDLIGVELYDSFGNSLVILGETDGSDPESPAATGASHHFRLPVRLTHHYTRMVAEEGSSGGVLILHGDSNLILHLLFTIFALALISIQLQRSFSRFKRKKGDAIQDDEDSYEQETLEEPEEVGQILVRSDHEKGIETKVETEVVTGESRSPSQLVDLEKERDMALASIDARDEFLASLSHEIRTSLNGIMGVLSLLRKSGLEGETRILLDAAKRSSDSLLMIIEDILDFSKITSGKIEFEHTIFNVRDVLEECISLYKDSARVKKISLHAFISPDIEAEVIGDPTRLRQVVTNLLSNAVKFTEKGDVSLSATLVDGTSEKQRVLVSVEDTGIGIDPEELENIFDMFTQADQNTSKKYGGTGVGLSVCKNLIELQGGKLGVKSRKGFGAHFWFTLDFKRIEKEREIIRKLFSEAKNILTYCNCEICTTIIHQYLGDHMVSNYPAENVEEIIQHLDSVKESSPIPDIILVDYGCVENNIEEVLDSIATHFPDPMPPCYVSLRYAGIEQLLLKSGVAGVIHKPIRMQQLQDMVSGIKRTTVEEAPAVSEQILLRGKVLLVDDEYINQHVGEMILKKMGLVVELANSGEEALEKTARTRYDVVLMDIQMPGMSGIEATEAIRLREEETGEKPHVIMALTANALDSMREKCLERGMDDFIVKPIQPEVMVRHLKPHLRESDEKVVEKVQEVSLPKVDLDDLVWDDLGVNDLGDGDRVIWDRSLALNYLGGDEDLLNDLMRLFIERKGKLMGAIEEAMQTTDSDAISCAAHAFKGAVNHFAAKRCQTLALTIEKRAGDGWIDGLDAYFVQLKAAADDLEEELKQHVKHVTS